jgi:hypothetical protein
MKIFLVHYCIPLGEMGELTHVVVAYTKEQAISVSRKYHNVKDYDILYVHEIDLEYSKNPRVEAVISYIK